MAIPALVGALLLLTLVALPGPLRRRQARALPGRSRHRDWPSSRTPPGPSIRRCRGRSTPSWTARCSTVSGPVVPTPRRVHQGAPRFLRDAWGGASLRIQSLGDGLLLGRFRLFREGVAFGSPTSAPRVRTPPCVRPEQAASERTGGNPGDGVESSSLARAGAELPSEQ